MKITKKYLQDQIELLTVELAQLHTQQKAVLARRDVYIDLLNKAYPPKP